MTPVIEFRVHRFSPKGLDPISVYIEEYGPKSSRVTVQCYGNAWTTYWGSHGDKGVESFMVGCNAEYIAESLKWGTNGMMLKSAEKHHMNYLTRIARAIQAEFSSKIEAEKNKQTL